MPEEEPTCDTVSGRRLQGVCGGHFLVGKRNLIDKLNKSIEVGVVVQELPQLEQKLVHLLLLQALSLLALSHIYLPFGAGILLRDTGLIFALNWLRLLILGGIGAFSGG